MLHGKSGALCDAAVEDALQNQDYSGLSLPPQHAGQLQELVK